MFIKRKQLINQGYLSAAQYSSDIFINHLMTMLHKIKLENKSCHLMGDFLI